MRRERIIQEFIEFTGVESLSFKERKMADLLMRKLTDIGMNVYEDDAGEKSGGECGNVIGVLKGDRALPSIILLAHMDTVGPCHDKKCVFEGDIVKSDGNTILGGDDAAGMIIILEAIREIIEGGVRHGDILAVFTIAEEVGLVGARNLDFEKIKANYAIVFDMGGPAGTVAFAAPTQVTIDIAIKGKAAHAGMEPEKGVSAIQVFAHAVSKMNLGRIDAETTANIGVVNGGTATNIVCEDLTAKAEVRSHSETKLDAQVIHMKRAFTEACGEFGAELTFNVKTEYKSYTIDPASPIMEKLRCAAKKLGIEIVLEKTGGGSDTNVLNEKGIMSVNISAGMFDAHTRSEYADMGIMEKTIDLMLEMFNAFQY
jgi:tripeptide aminopeptidase